MNIDWQRAAASGRSQWRCACPVCQKSARDDAVSVDCVNLRAMCHRCESVFFPDDQNIKPVPACDDSERIERSRWLVEKTLNESRPIRRDDAVYRYLTCRLGCELDHLPAVKCHSGLRLYADDCFTVHPAMVVPFIAPTGEVVGVHRTWITPQGRVKRWKGINGITAGSALRLFKATDTLSVTEGIETALAVHKVNCEPVWALGSSAMLTKFVPPPGVKRLTICGDNDEVGAAAAWRLYNRLKEQLDCSVAIPEKQNADWLDSLRGEQ